MQTRKDHWPKFVGVSVAFTLLSSTAGAWDCVTERKASCNKDVCQFSDAGDEPMHFSFSQKKKSFEIGLGEGSQAGKVTIIETPDALAVINTKLGPFKMGGREMGPGRNDLFVAQIDKKTKTFFVNSGGDLLTGSCSE
jgi:hypothetical protein